LCNNHATKVHNIYGKLLDHQEKAIKRAKELRKMHKRNRNAETENPSTTVDELVEYLNSLQKE